MSPKQVNILIVEDEDSHYELIRLGFEGKSGSYQLQQARSFREARKIIGEKCPDLVLADWKLPDGEGIELITKDESGNCLFPVIVMTSHGNETWAVNALKCGALDYIVKSTATFSDIERIAQRALRDWKNSIERKKAEDALKRSEEKYRIVAENTFDWEFWQDADGRFLYISPACEKITGYSARDFEKDHHLLSKLIYWEDKKKFDEHRHLAKEFVSEEMEFRIVRPDGEIRWISHACRPVFDPESRFLGTRGSNRDITDRKTAEQEKEKLIGDLQNALADIKKLHGIIPICSSCKRIRNGKGAWTQLEVYIRENSDAEFSHGLCQECAKKLFPNYTDPYMA